MDLSYKSSLYVMLEFSSHKTIIKETIKKVASDKAAKTLLGELYVDRQYLEQLSMDETLTKDENGKSESILELINAGIKYLDTRTDFWRQQKPMYTR